MVRNTEEARGQLTGLDLEAFETIVAGASSINWGQTDDPVAQVRCWEEAGVIKPNTQAIPDLEKVMFDDAASCREAIERFISDREVRQGISAKQREHVAANFTFPTALKRMLAEICLRLEDER